MYVSKYNNYIFKLNHKNHTGGPTQKPTLLPVNGKIHINIVTKNSIYLKFNNKN